MVLALYKQLSLKLLEKKLKRVKYSKLFFLARFILAVTFRKLCSIPSSEDCIWTHIHNCSHQFTDNHLLGHYFHLLITSVKLKWQKIFLAAKV